MRTLNANELMPPVSDTVYNVLLTAGVARSITMPTGAGYGNISSPYPVWVAGNGQTANVPTADNLTGNGSAYNKAQFYCQDSVISIASAQTQTISIEFWGLGL